MILCEPGYGGKASHNHYKDVVDMTKVCSSNYHQYSSHNKTIYISLNYATSKHDPIHMTFPNTTTANVKEILIFNSKCATIIFLYLIKHFPHLSSESVDDLEFKFQSTMSVSFLLRKVHFATPQAEFLFYISYSAIQLTASKKQAASATAR